MAHLIYRSSSADPGRVASSVKNSPLTNAEVDGNFKVIDVALAAVASTASPALTGTPTAPTATGGTNTTQIATTAFVTAAVSTSAAAVRSVATGGTGASTLAANGVLVGAGTSAVTTIAPGTTGNVLVSNGTAWTSAAGPASGATLVNDTTTNVTQYIGMSRITTGAWTAAYAASSKLYFNPSTGILSSTEFNSLSDITAKENVINITDATNTIGLLSGVEFTWKENGKKSAGVIAQQIEPTLPHLVSTTEEGIKSVNYMGIIGYLIESIKELNARIAVLENK